MSATSGKSGHAAILSIDGSALAESLDFTLTCDQGTIDMTNRDSDYWRQLIRSIRSWSISGTGLYIYNDLAKKELVAYYEDATDATLDIIFTFADGAVTATGTAILTSLTFPSPHDGRAEISFTLEGTDDLDFSAS